MNKSAALLDHARGCLVIVDVQQHFLDKLPLDERAPLVARIGWLMRVARALNIPMIATAEDMNRDGPLVPELAALLPAPDRVHNKMIFGLYQQDDIREAVLATGRDQFVLVGLETDVCIAHSAIGLAEAGHQVAVVDDACASPPPHHAHGLRRLQAAGIMITSVKGVFYEWVRDLERNQRIRAEIGRDLPPGLTL